MSQDDKDFLLHLYDKLWENINQRESTLWTFLSVYGAVIGIALGSATFKSIGIYGVFAALLLTYWAVHIVLNADWWSIRNRAMVGGIERRFPEACKGVVPTFYQGPKYTSQTLNNVSLLILTLIAYFLYMKTMLGYFKPGTIQSISTLAQISLLHFMFLALAYKALVNEEGNLREYYDTHEDLVRNAPTPASGATGTAPPDLEKKEHEDQWRLWRRPELFSLTLASAIPIYIVLFRSGILVSGLLWLAVVLLLTAAGLFAWQSKDYYREPPGNKQYVLGLGRKTDPRLCIVVILFSFSCIIIVASGVGRLPWSLPSSSSTAIADDLDQLKSELAALQVKTGALEDRVTGRPEYLRREEAARAYLKASDPRLDRALAGLSNVEAENARIRQEIAVLQRQIAGLEATKTKRKMP